jgi:capsular polysaccharide biosynthesis protein
MEIFGVLLKRLWLIALASVFGFAAAYAVSRFAIAPKYTSSVSLYVNNTSEAQPLSAVNINDINASQKLVNTYIVILQDNEVLGQLGQRLLEEYDVGSLGEYIPMKQTSGPPQVDTEGLRGMVSMSSVNNTEVLKIEAETKSAELSARICTIMTEIAPAVLMRVVKAGSVEVIGSAKPADEQSSPRVMLNSVIGLAAGMLLAAAISVLAHILDNTVKDEEGLKQRFNIPVLGEIPDFSAPQKGGYSHYGKH